ncbi:MAG: hypothetical protein ABIT47_00355 [Candidatus Paceibacterota bacterium]
MKKFLSFALVSAIAIAAATPATASVLNINLESVTTAQSQAGNLNQQALSVAARVGTVGNDDAVTSTAANIGQMVTQNIGVNQDPSFVNGNVLADAVGQSVNGAVKQVAVSVAGTGSVGSGGSVSSTAANIGQMATVTVNVSQ